MKNFRFWLLISILVFVCFSCWNEKGQTHSQSKISVFGTGTVKAQPDMLQISISLSSVARTTQTAQEEVNRMVRQVLSILKNNNIDDKNIITASLNFRTEYDWSSGRRTLIGQRAEQVITFSIDDIGNNNERVSAIIDRLTLINGIELNQMNFSIKNNTEYFIRSRELAFENAVNKINQYATLAGLKKVKILSISEEDVQHISPMMNRASNQLVFETSAARQDASSIIPTGELEIVTRINVVFLLE